MVLREQFFGATNAAVADSLNQLVAVLSRRTGQSDVREAETLARRSVALQKARWGEEHEEVAQSLQLLAWSLREDGPTLKDYMANRPGSVFRRRCRSEPETALSG